MAEGESRIRRFYLFRAVTSFTLWMPFWTLWAYENLDSMFLIAVVDAAFWGTMLAFQIPAGLVGDKYGRKAVLLTGEVLFAVGLLAFGFSNEFWQYVVANIIWALGVCFIVSGDTPFVYDTLLELNRASEFTVIMLTATVVMYISNAAACAVGGIIVQHTGHLEWTLIIASVIAIAGSTTVLMLKEPKVDRSGMTSYKRHFGTGLRKVLRSRPIMILILFQIVIEVGIYVMAIFRSVYMNDDLKLDHLSIGVFFASFLIVAAIIIRLARKIEGTLGERRALVFLYCSIFVSFVIVFVVRSPIAIATQYLIYIVAGVQGPIINGYINRRVDSEHRSTVMAIATFTFTLLLMIVEIGAGYVATEWGLIESLMVLALTTAPVALVLMILWNREIEREKAETTHPSPT